MLKVKISRRLQYDVIRTPDVVGYVTIPVEKKHFEDCDVTTMASEGPVTSSVTSPFDSPWPLFYRLPIVIPTFYLP